VTTSAERRSARLIYGVLIALLICTAAVTAAWAGWLHRSRSIDLPALHITTSPPGCGVSLDGSYLGVAPRTVEQVSPGEHFLRASRDGYQARTVRVQLDASSAPRKVHLQLVPLETCRLEVRSTPPGATVVLDGENRGNTPMVIQGLHPGEHRLVLRRARYEPWYRTLQLAAGKPDRIEARLEDSFLKFLNGAVAAEPRNMLHRAERFHYMMTRQDWKGAAESFFDALALTATDGVRDPGKGGLWHWFSRDAGTLRKDREGIFGRTLGKRLAALAGKNPQAAVKVVGLLRARSRMRSRRMRNTAVLRRLCFEAVAGAAAHRPVAEAGLALASELRLGAEIKRIMAAAVSARPGDSKYVGMLAIKVVNLIKGGGIGGSFRAEALELVTTAVEKCLKSEKDAVLRGRLHRLLAKVQVLQDKSKLALSDQEKAIAELRSSRKPDGALLALWRLERALLLIELKRSDEAARLLKELSTNAPPGPVRTRAAAALKEITAPVKESPEHK
jgi:PEGA domain